MNRWKWSIICFNIAHKSEGRGGLRGERISLNFTHPRMNTEEKVFFAWISLSYSSWRGLHRVMHRICCSDSFSQFLVFTCRSALEYIFQQSCWGDSYISFMCINLLHSREFKVETLERNSLDFRWKYTTSTSEDLIIESMFFLKSNLEFRLTSNFASSWSSVLVEFTWDHSWIEKKSEDINVECKYLHFWIQNWNSLCETNKNRNCLKMHLQQLKIWHDDNKLHQK